MYQGDHYIKINISTKDASLILSLHKVHKGKYHSEVGDLAIEFTELIAARLMNSFNEEIPLKVLADKEVKKEGRLVFNKTIVSEEELSDILNSIEEGDLNLRNKDQDSYSLYRVKDFIHIRMRDWNYSITQTLNVNHV